MFINVHTQQKPKSYVLQDFTLDMYFRQFWQDPRLQFERRASLEKLVVGAEYIKLIWVPDTFFVNEKTAYFHDATTDNQFLRILHTGEILRSIRWVYKVNSNWVENIYEKRIIKTRKLKNIPQWNLIHSQIRYDFDE